MEKHPIKNALPELKANLTEVARVFEWASLMGYEDPKKFSETFLRYYGVRPQKIMELVRLKSIIRYLRKSEKPSNLRIARMHSLPCEKTLNNFTNYHAGHSPTRLREMDDREIQRLTENLWNRVLEEYGVTKLWNAPEESLS